MNILKMFGSTEKYCQYNNLTIRKCFEIKGRGHRCAQGHYVRKLLRIIYHLLETKSTV